MLEDAIISLCTEKYRKRRLEPKRPTIIPSEKNAVITPAKNTEVFKFSWINVADQNEKAPSAPPIKNREKPKSQKDTDLKIFVAAFTSNLLSLKGTYFECG